MDADFPNTSSTGGLANETDEAFAENNLKGRKMQESSGQVNAKGDESFAINEELKDSLASNTMAASVTIPSNEALTEASSGKN